MAFRTPDCPQHLRSKYSLLYSQACVPVWHLEHRIVLIICDRNIACCIARLESLWSIQSIGLSSSFEIEIQHVVQLGLSPCGAFRAPDCPHHLRQKYSLLYSQACVPVWHLEHWIQSWLNLIADGLQIDMFRELLMDQAFTTRVDRK